MKRKEKSDSHKDSAEEDQNDDEQKYQNVDDGEEIVAKSGKQYLIRIIVTKL